jgi:hypothetical protein
MPVDMKVVWNAPRIEQIAGRQMPRLMTMIGTEYTNDVKRSMADSPRGGINVNKRGQRRSAPGEPPAPEFGDLIKSVRFVVRKTMAGWIVECGSTLRKAVYLEFGAARGRVMQARDMSGKFTQAKTMSWLLYPRPVWGPAMLRLRRQLPYIIGRLRGR